MANKKEFVVLKFAGNIGAKLEKLYNEGYRKWRHFADEKQTYLVLRFRSEAAAQ